MPEITEKQREGLPALRKQAKQLLTELQEMDTDKFSPAERAAMEAVQAVLDAEDSEVIAAVRHARKLTRVVLDDVYKEEEEPHQ